MKAQNLKIAEKQEQLCGYTSKGRRERVTLMVLAPGIHDWTLIGHLESKGEYFVLEQGDLRPMILEAELYKASFPDVPLASPYLQPKGIRGYQRRDVARQNGWALGVKSEPVDFRNADELYQFLRGRGYRMEGNQALKEGQDERTWLFCSHETGDSQLAWETASYRLEHNGELPTHLELPAGTCPKCLSRNVADPMNGEGLHCQECFHVG